MVDNQGHKSYGERLHNFDTFSDADARVVVLLRLSK